MLYHPRYQDWKGTGKLVLAFRRFVEAGLNQFHYSNYVGSFGGFGGFGGSGENYKSAAESGARRPLDMEVFYVVLGAWLAGLSCSFVVLIWWERSREERRKNRAVTEFGRVLLRCYVSIIDAP